MVLRLPAGRLRVFERSLTALLAYETGAVDLTTVVPPMAQEPLLDARDAGRRSRIQDEAIRKTALWREKIIAG